MHEHMHKHKHTHMHTHIHMHKHQYTCARTHTRSTEARPCQHAQIEFIDAPGALGPVVPSLGREMWDAVRSADLALVMVDASSPGTERQARQPPYSLASRPWPWCMPRTPR
jgi:GTPase Era involved in 16S rRNA processing